MDADNKISDLAYEANRGRESKQHTDRETLMMTLHVQGAFCGLCDYESAIYDDRSDGVEWRCEDCERTLGGYADAILAAPSLSLVAAHAAACEREDCTP